MSGKKSCLGRRYISAFPGRRSCDRRQLSFQPSSSERHRQITLREIYSSVLGEKSLWVPRTVPHRCLVSSNVERYFVGLAAKADNAVLKTLEHKTLADSLAEWRKLDAAK
jgi:hypothetical protein